MLHTISTTTYDPFGVVELDCIPTQTTGEVRRRMNRVATLDGGAVVNDYGFTDADRVIELRWAPTSVAVEANVERLVRTYNRLIVSTPAGVWLTAPEYYAPATDESTLRLLALEKLSA